jgi:hypothetical protein
MKNIFWLVLILLNTNIYSQTLSPKRGISGDLLDNNDCIAVDNYLSWYYNWANTPNGSIINTHQNFIEFCPMLWNGTWNAIALTTYLDAHPEVEYLLTFNEPNLAWQANMTPAQAAALWPQVEAIADAYNLKIVSPAMTYCTADCIPGYNTGFNSGTDWLDDFFSACPGCRVDYIGLHIYDTWYWGFRGSVGDNITGYKKYGKPIWVTEFAHGALSGVSMATNAALMVDAIDYMEQDPDIFRYAWFILRSSPATGTIDILGQTTGTVKDLGLIYMNMSSYDKNYFHSVNSTIEAEHYLDKTVTYCNWNGSACTWPYSILLEKTTDVSGTLDAYNFLKSTEDTLFYNIDIPYTQAYNIDFRVSSTSASTISVRNSSGTLLGTTTSLNTSGSWSTMNLSGISLAAGQQKIYFTASNGAPLKLNWFRINCTTNCSGLPVEIVSLDISKISSGQTLINWKTSSEKNNNYFIIERSINGIQFDSIGTVNSDRLKTTNYYTYTDIESPIDHDIYYRLKQVDYDGNYSYSSLKVLGKNNPKLIISGNFIISSLTSETEIYYTITNLSGQSVLEDNYHAPAGIMNKKIPLDNLNKGIYILRVLSNNEIVSGKFIKE